MSTTLNDNLLKKELDKIQNKKQKLTDYKRYICFNLDHREYGLDIEVIQEIIIVEYIRKLIFMPAYVVGVINLRGEIIVVLDIKQLFNIGYTDFDINKTKLIVCRDNNKTIAFLADEISKIRNILPEDIQQTPSTFKEIDSKYIIGMNKIDSDKLLILLNFSEIMQTDKIKRLSEVDE